MNLMIIFLVLVSISVFIVCTFHEYVLFNPTRRIHPFPPGLNLRTRDVYFRSGRGYSLYGWHVYPERKLSSYVVLVCHGTRGNLTTPFRVLFLEALSRLGMEIFIFDYSGTGKSGGKVSEENSYRDARAAFEYLSDSMGISAPDIIVFGRSLGGPVACRLALEIDPALLILDSTFYSMTDEVMYLLPFIPSSVISGIMGEKFSTYRYYRKINCPSIILHGTGDRVVPFASAEKLYMACSPVSGVFTVTGGAGHKPFLADPSLYVKSLMSGMKALSFEWENRMFPEKD
jgi:pimeloyl-ACP methyl ester carboxylesterase